MKAKLIQKTLKLPLSLCLNLTSLEMLKPEVMLNTTSKKAALTLTNLMQLALPVSFQTQTSLPHQVQKRKKADLSVTLLESVVKRARRALNDLQTNTLLFQNWRKIPYKRHLLQLMLRATNATWTSRWAKNAKRKKLTLTLTVQTTTQKLIKTLQVPLVLVKQELAVAH